MNTKYFVLIIWTVVVIVFLASVGKEVTKDEIYTGTDIEFYTDSNNNIQIDAPKVAFQAASDQFFALYNENGEAIAGAPTEKPLGWNGKHYFAYGPQEISGGKWLFEVGYASVKITSDATTTVRLIARDSITAWLVCTLIALVFWLIGYLIGDYFLK